MLMVMAHPDDEILFGWPIFQRGDINKILLCCSTDENNPSRAWCSHRKNAMAEVCQTVGCKLFTIPAPSEFYKLNSRRQPGTNKDEIGDATSQIRIFKRAVKTSIDKICDSENVDYIFTHNVYGEYGHEDHKLISRLVFEASDVPIVYSDIRLPTNWDSCEEPDRLQKIFFKRKIETRQKRDDDLFEKLKALYVRDGVWTWSRDESLFSECNIYVND